MPPDVFRDRVCSRSNFRMLARHGIG